MKYKTTPLTQDVNDLLIHSGKALQELGAENTKLSEAHVEAKRALQAQTRQLDFWKVSSQLVQAGVIPPARQEQWVKEASAKSFPPDYYLERMRQREMNPFEAGTVPRGTPKTSAPVTPVKQDDPYRASEQAKLERLQRFHNSL